MEASSIDDCYFYYYSSCTKGSDCPYRHCEAALGTETVCTLWRQGLCYRINCKFRHMESRINRSSIPCYWETQPSGCRKPHCVFFHQKSRSKINVGSEAGGLILPVASQVTSSNITTDSSTENKWESAENLPLSPSSQSIQPVVVNLDGEESDTESTTGTPKKVIPAKEKVTSPSTGFSDASAKEISSETDLGIKTLEEIKMAKIHRESEHFYKPGKADGANMQDTASVSVKVEVTSDESSSYYAQGDLRLLLKKKRDAPEKERSNGLSRKRVISLKKSTASEDECPALRVTIEKNEKNEITETTDVKMQSRSEGKCNKTQAALIGPQIGQLTKDPKLDNSKDDMGFRIKTLDEIRQEREKKQSDKIISSVETEVVNGDDESGKSAAEFSDASQGSSFDGKVKSENSKRKLQRKPLHLYKSLQEQTSDINVSTKSLKRSPLDVPFCSKIKKLDTVHQTFALELSSEYEGKNSKPAEVNEKTNENSLTFKRRNIVRRKNTSDIQNYNFIPTEEDLSCPLPNSSLQEETASETSKLSDASSQNGACVDSDDSSFKADNMNMLNGKEASSSVISSPPVPEKRPITLSTVDELDNLFLASETDIALEEMDTSTDTKAEDLFLEVEQMLQS